MSKEADYFNDLFRAKLKDLEVDIKTEDWEIIANRLPKSRLRLTVKRWIYAAAIIIFALSLGGGSLYWIWHRPAIIEIVNNAGQGETEQTIDADNINDDADIPVAMQIEPVLIASVDRAVEPVAANTAGLIEDSHDVGVKIPDTEVLNNKMNLIPVSSNPVPEAYIAPVYREAVRGPTARKWRFGTGIGGLAIGSNNTTGNYLLRSTSYENPYLTMLNAPSDFNMGNMPRTNIKHKMPLSFGISASRYITNRWSISTGITYTLLRAEWETLGTYNTRTKQHLHFIGIPVTFNYKIAEWKNILLYASAGGMGEINFAGQQKTELFVDDAKTDDANINRVRIKEPQWSLGAHVGLSYPVIRPISAFAEVGASYYFNNKSEIETIYTEKPFYLSPQLGLRLSF